MSLLTIEEQNSQKFYIAYLNNIRALIKIFDKLLPKDVFIKLPGDEIVEKKHANVKILTAQMQSADLSKRTSRKWPGLGPNVFEVDYASLFDAYKEFKSEGADGEEKAPTPAQPPAKGAPVVEVVDPSKNELTTEIDVMNTDHHKVIVKARNEYYGIFKNRFEGSIKEIMSKYDLFRKDEIAFSNYWNQNLKEITGKHI